MEEQHLSGLAALLTGKEKAGDFLQTLPKNEEGGYDFDAFRNAFGEKLKERLTGQKKFGAKERGMAISNHLKEKFGFAPNEGEHVEDYVQRYVSTIQPKELDRETLANNPIVKQMIQDASKAPELTKELLQSNPLVGELLRNAVDQTKGEYEPKLQQAQQQLQNWQKRERDNKLRLFLSNSVDDLKLDYGTNEGAKEKAVNTLFTLANAGLKWTELNGKLVVADENGNAAQSELGFTIPLKDKLLEISPYPQHQHDPKLGGLGAGSTGGKGTRNFSDISYESVMQEVSKLRIAGKRKEAHQLLQDYIKSQSQS